METDITSPHLDNLLTEHTTLVKESNPANRHVYASQITQAIQDRIQQLEILIARERVRLQAEQDAANAAEAAAAAASEAQAQIEAALTDTYDALPAVNNTLTADNTRDTPSPLPAEAIAVLSDEPPPTN